MRHSKQSRKRGAQRGGFTRVEAVAIVGVAGTLSALVMPVAAQGTILDLIFGRGVVSNRSGSCQSNLKQIGLGLMQYTQDYDELMPRASIGGDSYGWANAIQPYIKSTELFQCPAEKNVKAEEEAGNETPLSELIKKAGFTDYWYNRSLSGKSLPTINEPSRSIAMGDGDGGSAASTARYTIPSLPKNWLETKRSPARRHVRSKVEGANYAFADGHVKWYQPTNIAGPGQPTFSIEDASAESGP